MRAVLVLALLGIAGVWIAAFAWPTETAAPPAEFVGAFRMIEFRRSSTQEVQDPFPPAQERRFLLRPDGTYAVSMRVSGGEEMLRREGTFEVEDRVVTFRQVSQNRIEDRATDRFYARFEEDETGELMILRHAEQGYELVFRPLEEEPAQNAAAE